MAGSTAWTRGPWYSTPTLAYLPRSLVQRNPQNNVPVLRRNALGRRLHRGLEAGVGRTALIPENVRKGLDGPGESFWDVAVGRLEAGTE